MQEEHVENDNYVFVIKLCYYINLNTASCLLFLGSKVLLS